MSLFLQVVWDDTIEIGCGIAKDDVDTFIVCQYSPSIALPNEYTAHIRPPKAGIDILGRMRSVGLYVEENSTYQVCSLNDTIILLRIYHIINTFNITNRISSK